ncbi:MAG TPA: hypothetical protein ENN19_14265 [Chloroflexi bacterium]|nr:hypothetical protein [Chloroflexota bacterium]
MSIQNEKQTPLGVIGSITAGFEIVGWRLWLVALPMLLDLLLWLGPQISLDPLMDRIVIAMRTQAMPTSLMAQQIDQAIQTLETIGEGLDLASLLSVIPLLHLPSLLAWRLSEAISPMGDLTVLSVSNFGVLLGWMILLMPIGLLLGFLYLNGLARRVRDARLPDQSNADSSLSARTNFGKFIRVLLFAFVLLVVGVVLGGVWMLVVGMMALISPVLGFVMWALGMGLGIYLALNMVFVVPALLVGERGLWQAIWESFVLMQMQAPSVLGLLLLTFVIYEGLGLVWTLPSLDSWSMLLGIFGNSCVATGLAAATFVFYQERVGQLAELRQTTASTS